MRIDASDLSKMNLGLAEVYATSATSTHAYPLGNALFLFESLQIFSLGTLLVVFVERIATADQADARRGCAIAKRAANQLSHWLLPFERVAWQTWIR